MYFIEKKTIKNVLGESAEISIFLNGRRDHMVNLIFCIIFTSNHVRNNFLVSKLVFLWSENTYVLISTKMLHLLS